MHPDDVDAVGRDNCALTPTGAAFVTPAVRRGLLPDILAALMAARCAGQGEGRSGEGKSGLPPVSLSFSACLSVSLTPPPNNSPARPPQIKSARSAATRAELRSEADAAQRAVLEGRQKALKLTANALYGFTGAQASPLQCAPLADSCLALGAATCRAAAAAIPEVAASGALGAAGDGARVIYAQTDSVFVHLPRAPSAAAAVEAGVAAARAVTARLARPPVELKFEKVFAPLLLLHVNRYAGRAFETAAAAAAADAGGGGGGDFQIKGVKAIWRQSAPIVADTLHVRGGGRE